MQQIDFYISMLDLAMDAANSQSQRSILSEIKLVASLSVDFGSTMANRFPELYSSIMEHREFCFNLWKYQYTRCELERPIDQHYLSLDELYGISCFVDFVQTTINV